MKKQTAVEWLYDNLNKCFDKFDNGEYGYTDFVNESKEVREQAKAMEKEQLEKELISFFLYFRDNGERLLGFSIEQLVKSYLSSKILD